jgi:hypothetical protein
MTPVRYPAEDCFAATNKKAPEGAFFRGELVYTASLRNQVRLARLV